MSHVKSPLVDDGIAIVGIGCRLPRDIQSPADLWDFLCSAGDAVAEVPRDRWNAETFHDPDRNTPGKIVTRRGAFLSDVGLFDAAFFGISPREAAVMDPQQRLLLECTWNALDDAGIRAETLAGSATGVYVGASHSDYNGIQKFGRRQIDLHTATGGALSIAAARISHRLDLKGPSFVVDTACSSSLVALDAACKAVGRGDCSLAIVGGVNVILAPDVSITFSRASMLSPDGMSRAFDSRANGYVRGEGAAVVILKPLAAALADNDPVRAVIRATAVNQDGRTSTITVPSYDAQCAMLRDLCRKGRIEPSQVGYVEAHGTGTPIGDPIEATAIGSVFGPGREKPCRIGSLKTNLGHLEPASGIAGLIKAALCIERGAIPPNLHFETPNPNIDFDRLNIGVVTSLTEWDTGSTPRLAVVNSFGFGGTNASVLLEQAPRGRAAADDALFRSETTPIVISAASRSALATRARNIADRIAAHPDDFDALADTLARRRSHLQHRAVVQALSPEDGADKLLRFAEGEAGAAISGRKKPLGRIVFAFTGQGAQWWGMAQGLLRKDDIFAEQVARIDRLFQLHAGWSLIDELNKDQAASRINETSVAQPATFALQVGLAARLRRCGLAPDAVVGHSIGEIAAAHVAGALSLSDAVSVVFHRSRLQERSRAQGTMAAVGLSEKRVRALLEPFRGALEIAAVNGPEMVTLAGPTAAVSELVDKLTTQDTNVFCRRLQVDYAFHSRQMDPYLGELRESLGEIRPGAGIVPIYSTVTGAALADIPLDAAYWARNLREPVLFRVATMAAIADGGDTFIEIGPHPALSPHVAACLDESGVDGLVVPVLRRDLSDDASLVTALATLHVNGIDADWSGLLRPAPRPAELPCYPWERQKHWAESEESKRARFQEQVHPLLGARMPTADCVWQSEIDSSHPRYLDDHRVRDAVVFPAAGYVEIMLAAAEAARPDRRIELEDVAFHEALTLSNNESVFLETAFDAQRQAVAIRSRQRDSDEWTIRATCRVRTRVDVTPALAPWQPAGSAPAYVDRIRFYQVLAREGHGFGDAFQGVRWVLGERGESLGRIQRPAELPTNGYVLHPALLDCCFQVIRGFDGFGDDRPTDVITLPIAITRIRMLGTPGDVLFSRATAVAETATEISTDISILDEAGRHVALIEGFRCRRIAKTASSKQRSILHREEWQPLPRNGEGAAPSAGKWLILDDADGRGEALAARMRESGQDITVANASAGDEQDQGKRLQALLAEMGPLHGVVHMAGLPEQAGFDEALLRAVRKCGLESLLWLSRALSATQPAPRLWVIGAGAVPAGAMGGVAGPAQAALTGFVRTMANELPELRPSYLDIDPSSFDLGEAAEEILLDGPETQVAYRNDARFVCRVRPASLDEIPAGKSWKPVAGDARGYRLTMRSPGSLQNLQFAEHAVATPGPGEVRVDVSAVSLNFRDVMAAAGLLPADAEPSPAWDALGFECSGVITATGENVSASLLGKRVAVIRRGSFASHLIVPLQTTFVLPENISLAEAAAIPTVYATARYSLLTIGNLRAGENVLIHSATGGVGLAAIAIARSAGATIFATAGTPEKRDYLKRLGVEHVFDSRNFDFVEEIRRASGGAGVDVILNSLSGEFIERSLQLLAPGGRFLEIGKRDVYENTGIGLRALRCNGAFFVIDLARLSDERPAILQREIEAVVEGVAAGELPPLPVTEFSAENVVAAFEHMSHGTHIGKVVVALTGSRPCIVRAAGSAPRLDPDASYVITGGTGGLGLATAEYICARGARHVVLAARSGAPNEEARATIDQLRGQGVSVTVVKADVSRAQDVAAVIASAAAAERPVRGVIHAAGLIEDALLTQLAPEQVRRAFEGKVLGAWQLHDATRDCDLDFFLLYSSIAGTVGSIGQAHYAAANRTLDAIAQWRQSQGLPALSVCWGPIADRGYLARHEEIGRYMEGNGLPPMPIADVYATLDEIIDRQAATLIGTGEIRWDALARSHVAVGTTPAFQHLIDAVDGPRHSEIADVIAAAKEPQRSELVAGFLREQVANVLKVSPASIADDRPLVEFGLDSLTSFELKNSVESQLGISVPVSRLLQRPTLRTLTSVVSERIGAVDKPGTGVAKRDAGKPAMSVGQEALWLVDQLEGHSTAYVLAMCVAVRPRLDVEIARKAFRATIARHDGVRMIFPADDLGPMAAVLGADRFDLQLHDVSSLPEAAVHRNVEAEAYRPFDLSAGPLLRLHLFRQQSRDILLLQLHHIVGDATSVAVLVEEMFESYFALMAGAAPASQPGASYLDFANRQRNAAARPQQHGTYWKAQLANIPIETTFPASQSGTGAGTGAAFHFVIDAAQTARLQQLARELDATLFGVLFAAYNVLLHRRTGASDLVVGTPVSGRARADDRLVGYVTNVLPIRTRIAEGASFSDLISSVAATLREGLDHQDYPFASMVRDLDIARDLHRPPVFQTMFSMEKPAAVDGSGFSVTLLNTPGVSIDLRDMTIEAVPIRRDRAHFDANFIVEEFKGRLHGVVDYRCDRLNEADVESLVAEFNAILECMAAAPTSPFSIRARPGRDARLAGPVNENVPDLIKQIGAVAAARSDAIAVEAEDRTLTYSALFEHAARLAGRLQAAGAKPGARIAFCLSRSSRLPVAMLGVLMTGAAYVPLDPNYPPLRLQQILDDAQPLLLLTDASTAARDWGARACLSVDDEADRSTPPAAPVSGMTDGLAYVIHTSGSTGRPLGVAIGRDGLNNFLAGMRLALPVGPDDRILALTTPAFDIAVLELLLPLTVGGSVVVASEETTRDARKLAARLDRGDITVMQATPATWQMLEDAGWAGQTTLVALSGGERLPKHLARALAGKTRALFNMYGPTETTVWSTVAKLGPDDDVSLGSPILNTELAVVDDRGQVVFGAGTGELLIGGRGLSEGYPSEPERTASRFAADPQDPSKRMFRTGDVVTLRTDGTLIFCGRRDRQVKLRGFRIELDEVEEQLRACPGVRDASVSVEGEDLSSQHLTAWLVMDEPWDKDRLQSDLGRRLPPYMVPSVLTRVAALPRLPNGKLDRRALRAMPGQEQPGAATEPQNEVEAALVSILGDLLPSGPIGRFDNFFAIGGTSLLAMRYLARASDAFNVELTAADVMQAPTVESLARLVQSRMQRPADLHKAVTLPIRKLWKPLPLVRAETGLAIRAAAIAYLPDEVDRVTTPETMRRGLRQGPLWMAAARTEQAGIAIITAPLSARELLDKPASALPRLNETLRFAARLGAKAVSLTGIIPSVTDFGRALEIPAAMTVTTGHATTISSMVLSIHAALRAAGRTMRSEKLAFVGLGAIGEGTLRAVLDGSEKPESILLCDVSAKTSQLESLAKQIRAAGFEGDIRVAVSNGPAPPAVYEASLIVGATNSTGVLDVDALRPGAIVVDDSFPHCFELSKAVARMRQLKDVMIIGGGSLRPRDPIAWHAAVPPEMMRYARVGEAPLLPPSAEITGCILSSAFAAAHIAPATLGPAKLPDIRAHRAALDRLGYGAADFRCGNYLPDGNHLSAFSAHSRTESSDVP